ncbi:ketoacyl-synt-domain-containing protein [Cubamyces sp. BRFM 1775]|nr:ketoacyl-synt-domain-containing protein [Cubamyces sp. BRFM 1775]
MSSSTSDAADLTISTSLSSWSDAPESPRSLAGPSSRSQCNPIAIVGMAADLPGAPNINELWTLLRDGIDTVEQIPQHRFDASPYLAHTAQGRSMNITKGNFLKDPASFDNAFFQASPREARSMDPQQRVLLKTAYRALDDAGYCPDATPTFDRDTFATFVGVATNDYVHNLRNDVDVYYATGTLQAFLSGRISYALGFGGPSIVLDTACSSSMVAIHQACRALSAGDCNAALAGGVNIISSPDMYLGLARGHFLSETGQCRPWDASADGYCRAEGCGLFVLKRLADAVAENDRILGVIRATEVNQSGKARSITHPHVPSQVALFEKLVSSADVHPHDISVVECHGTGTQAGDPAELEAIRSVFAVGRAEDNPLHITSIKASIGHAEAASGAASLAKLLLMLREQSIPRHISFKSLNPRIPDLSVDHVRIDATTVPWESSRQPKRLALLTNFGAAGSNGALILEEHIPSVRTAAIDRPLILGISCKTTIAAEQLRHAYLARLEAAIADTAALQDFAYTATARRQLYRYRISASGISKGDLVAVLRSAKVVEARPSTEVIFVFSGQGSQYPGMGSDLYRRLPAFAQIVDECHERLLAMDLSGVAEAFREEQRSPNGDNGVQFRTSQVALFVLEYALARLWISWGIEPCAVAGQSFGEFVALAVSGVLSLDDALRLVSKRAEVMHAKCKLYGSGMTSVRGAAKDFATLLGREPFSRLEVCCYNSETNFVVGGELRELQAFEDLCITRGTRHTRLDVPYAYHSAAMEPIVADLVDVFRNVHVSLPTIPVLSNVTGTFLKRGDTSAFTPDYLARHCRDPARLHQGMSDLASCVEPSSVAAYIEVGPHPTTLPLLRGLQTDGFPLLLPSSRRDAPGLETLCATLAQLYGTSVPVKWRQIFADLAPGAKVVDLPPYPFVENRFWVPYQEEARQAESKTPPREPSMPTPISALPDRNVQVACEGSAGGFFELDVSSLAELIVGHRVAGTPLCPASVYAELVLSAAISTLKERSSWSAEDVLDLVEVSYPKPLVYVPGRQDRLRVDISFPEGRRGSFTVSSAQGPGARSEVYCRGSFKRTTTDQRLSKLSYADAMVKREINSIFTPPDSPPSKCETFLPRTVYDVLFPPIVTYSAAYRTIKTITVDSSSSHARVYATFRLPESAPALGNASVHPIFVDTLFHTAGFLVNFAHGMNGRDAFICGSVDAVQVVPQAIDFTARYGVYAAVSRAEIEEGVGKDAAMVRAVAVYVYVLELDGPQPRIVARLKRARFRRVALDGFRKMLQAAAAGPRSSTDGVAACVERAPAKPGSAATYSASTRTIEETSCGDDLRGIVLRVIAETSGIPEGDVQDQSQLAHLGVDSLMLWEVAAQLRAVLPSRYVRVRELDARVLAEATTVSDLVRLVEDSCREGTRPAEDTMTPHQGAVLATSQDAKRHGCPDTAPDGHLDIHAVKGVLSTVLDISVDDIADDDELQCLGLDSLTSIEARHVFSTRFGVMVDEEALFACRTVQDVVCALSGDAARNASLDLHTPDRRDVITYVAGYELVRVQRAPEQGCRIPPLILVHDGSGGIGGYARLGPLGREVWAVRNFDIARSSELCGPYKEARGALDVVRVASVYSHSFMSAIRDWGRYNAGPAMKECFLGGWSFGGIVAFEMVEHFSRAGINVKGLILIDSPAPQTLSLLPDDLIGALARGSVGPGRGDVPKASNGWAPRGSAFTAQMRFASRALAAYTLPSDTQAQDARPRAVYLRATDPAEVVVRGSIKGLDEHSRAFFTKENDEWTLNSWEEALHTPKLEVLDVPGDHFSMFDRENMQQLTERLRQGLQLLSDG